MLTAVSRVPNPSNEPILTYAPKSSERSEIKKALVAMGEQQRELRSVIDGEYVGAKQSRNLCCPHDHQRVIGKLYQATESQVQTAIDAAQRAKHGWSTASFDDRAAVFLRAADLLSKRFRSRCNAATMLGQSKTVHQAEIDAACEMIDFWRFNVAFARTLMTTQPLSVSGVWNRTDYRPLEGFVLAVSPFNFTSIAGNLATAPALMGNTVVWKPATTSALAAQVIMDILIEAGLPKGVINMVHAPGKIVGDVALTHPNLGGIHFTGSTATFQHMWSRVGENIARYRAYPRLIGETGGKNFIFAHPSADVDALCTAIIRGAFEYQGQKCSAASRVYLPESLWRSLSEKLEAQISDITMGDITDHTHFMGAVIDRASFDRIQGALNNVVNSQGANIWLGGGCDDSVGYFIEPTVVLAQDPTHPIMKDELFGPVVSIHRYPDNNLSQALELCDTTTPYGLTGAIFARDQTAIAQLTERFRFAAGNFYINDKPTGAIVGQQPFGGARSSGTNDKAGSALNLQRWTSPRTIKETFAPPSNWTYPFMLT